jgi:hypothetical protein
LIGEAMPEREPVTLRSIDIALPLYDAFWRLDDEIRERFPAEKWQPSGVCALGISFSRVDSLSNGGYWCTPLNTLAFARTGGDGEHYSFLIHGRKVDENTPIVLTAPSSDNLNLIVAPNFETFLRAGLSRAFFGLSQFAYNRKRTLEAYGSPDWTANRESDESVGYVPDARQRDIMQFVATKLDLQPFWYTPYNYTEYQAALHLLDMSDEYKADEE